MREYGSNIILPSLDNLFSSEQERQDAKLEKIQILPLTELHPFRNHPFQVRDDDEMDKMVDSIKEYGVMTPAIVRPRKDGGYEIVAGHRRCHASQRAGVETMPCIVRDMVGNGISRGAFYMRPRKFILPQTGTGGEGHVFPCCVCRGDHALHSAGYGR